jgi:hypothetical protein
MPSTSSGQRNRRCGTFTRRGNGAWANRRAATDQFWVDHAAAVVDLQNRFEPLDLIASAIFASPAIFSSLSMPIAPGKARPRSSIKQHSTIMVPMLPERADSTPPARW